MSGDHPNDSIIENGQNTEKSPGDLRRLAVTQTPVKNYRLTLMWKALIIIITITTTIIIIKKSRKQMGRKTTVWILQRTKEIAQKLTHSWLRRRNLKRETESLLIVTQNNAIRNNYIKVKIDYKLTTSKCRLCGDRDGMVNHVRSECCKLVQK